MFRKIIHFYKKAFRFITDGIWVNTPGVRSKRGFWTKQLKVFLITLREFNVNNVNQQASSLTFYLLMSLVPIAAMMFAVSKGFGIEEQLVNWLNSTFPDQQDVVTKITQFASAAIDNARGGWVTGLGLIILFWSSLNMLVQIEESLNSIWQAKRPRSWSRRFADYFSVLLVAPILLLLSNSITVTFEYYLNAVTEYIPFLANITPVIFMLLPLLLIWILFTLLYMVMPNVRVKFLPAFSAAIIAGTAFQIIELIYIHSQVSIAKYNAIYGSLAAIPLFLLCAKIGWQIVLFGAELSFAYQNIDSYEPELDAKNISNYNMKVLSIYVMHLITKDFKEGNTPNSANELSVRLNLSMRVLNIVLDGLFQTGLIVEALTDNEKDKDKVYIPSMDIDKITIATVIGKIEHLGEKVIIGKTPIEVEKIKVLMNNISEGVLSHGGEKKVVDIN